MTAATTEPINECQATMPLLHQWVQWLHEVTVELGPELTVVTETLCPVSAFEQTPNHSLLPEFCSVLV